MKLSHPISALEAFFASRRQAGKVLLAISGGPDSMALGEAFFRASLKPKAATPARRAAARGFVVASINHGLRSEASNEVALVASVAHERWKVPFITATLQPPASPPDGVLEWARRERYSALVGLAESSDCVAIVTAHHADDAIETLWWRLLRGAAPAHLAGMAEVSAYEAQGIRRPIWRPFLSLRQPSLEAFANKHHVPFVRDPSNADTTHTRAWLRHQLLPQIESRFPGSLAHGLSLMTQLSEIEDFLELEAQRTRRRFARRKHLSHDFLAADFRTLAPPIRRRMLRCFLGPDTKAAVVDALMNPKLGLEVRLNGNRLVVCRETGLHVVHRA